MSLTQDAFFVNFDSFQFDCVIEKDPISDADQANISGWQQECRRLPSG
jgi:hypothetical protein